MSAIIELKARYFIPAAWRDLGLPGGPAKCCRSPFPADHRNGDAHPSFSVYAEGTRWKDQATGEGGDVLDLVKKARSCDAPAAIAWIRARLGLSRPSALAATAVVAAPTAPPGCRGTPTGTPWPTLRPGTAKEHAQLAELRGLAPAAVALAAERGFLHFGTLWGRSFWAITDGRRKLVELRRCDGSPWPAFGRLAERKSHCLGSGKNWPIGTLESAPYHTVAWLEGAPDLLAFWHFALIERRTERVAPVAMLGAANHLVAADALARFRGKLIVLYAHRDEAGATAALAWARQLRAAGAKVAAFDLSGIEKDDGTAGKDLNDLCQMSADCFEKPEKYRFREVLP